MAGLLDTIAEAYMRNVGNPARQLVGGGVRGLLGFDPPEYADSLGMEAYRNAAALGNAPGINAPVGAFKAAAKVVPEAAMFIGALAKTWDKASNAKAVQMEKAGKDAREIWRETGNLKGPDGKWRQEISDDAAKMAEVKWTKPYADVPNVEAAKVGDALSHRQLFDSYPFLKDADLILNPNIKSSASYYAPQPDIGLGEYIQWNVNRGDALERMRDWVGRMNDPASIDYWKTQVRENLQGPFKADGPRAAVKEMRQYMKEKAAQVASMEKGMLNESPSTPLHELQHAIQQREGFAKGGSVESMKQLMAERADVKARFDRALNQFMTETDPIAKSNAQQEMTHYGVRLAKLPKADGAGDAYMKLAGEAEARATQARMNMTPAERRATFPYDSYDVPVDQLIVRGLLAP